MAHNSSDLRERHSRKCASHDGGRCNCTPSYQARVWIAADQQRRTRTFSGKGARSAAKLWLTDAAKAAQDGKLRAPTKTTLREAFQDFLDGAAKGEIRKRGGGQYKPAYLRQARSAVYKHVPAQLLDRRLDAITYRDLRELKERLQGAGLAGSTVRNVFVPLQVVFKRAKQDGLIATKPTDDLELPSANTCDRSATPQQAAAAIAALPESEQALWATAFYTGLRRGELRALRVDNIKQNYIDVQHGWDDVEGEQAPKSEAGVRRVPLCETLRPYLANVRGEGLAFGKTASEPFMPREVSDAADAAWKAAGLERWTLKECRASFRTWLDTSAMSDTRADRYHGHADQHVRGRYIIPPESQLAEDAAKLDAYLSGATARKVATLRATG